MKQEFSAGGVVYRKEDKNIFILVGQHSYSHGWVFPKGLIGDKIAGEEKEATALREVEEETGAIGKIIRPLEPTTYVYEWQGEKRQKTVYYFLMEYLEGDITKHDFEMEDVRWIPSKQVEQTLTFPSDKTVWKEAEKMFNKFKNYNSKIKTTNTLVNF